VLYLYRREGKNLSRPVRFGLASLRLLALAGVLGMLLEPAIVFVKKEMNPSRVVVLVDKSESMDLKDAYADVEKGKKVAAELGLKGIDDLRGVTRTALAEKAVSGKLLAALAQNGDRVVGRHDFAGQIIEERNAATTQKANAVDRSTTGVGTAIKQVLAQYRGQPWAGILVVTDGQSNTGETLKKAAEAAAAEGVPVVSLAIGTPEGPRNAKLAKIDVSPVVFVRDPNQVHVLIESRGLANQPATVILEKQPDGGTWEEIGRKSIVLEESGTLQTVTFEFKEDRPTKLALRAKIEDVGPELTTADNMQLAEVRAIRQKIKVLFVAGGWRRVMRPCGDYGWGVGESLSEVAR
jgi:lipocalin